MYGIYYKVLSKSGQLYNGLKPGGAFERFTSTSKATSGPDYYKLSYEIKTNNSNDIILILKDVAYGDLSSNNSIEFIAASNAFTGLGSKAPFRMSNNLGNNIAKHKLLDIKNFIEMGVAGQPSVVVGPHFGPIT